MNTKNIKIAVCESKTGKALRPYQRALFVENYTYSENTPTAKVLADLREFAESFKF